jgi:hypothetical protein
VRLVGGDYRPRLRIISTTPDTSAKALRPVEGSISGTTVLAGETIATLKVSKANPANFHIKDVIFFAPVLTTVA